MELKVVYTNAHGRAVEITPAHAWKMVREILGQLAPNAATSIGEFVVTKRFLVDLFGEHHPANARRGGRLWSCLSRQQYGLGVTLLCRRCPGGIDEVPHQKHREEDEYILVSDILEHEDIFLSGKVTNAGPAMIKDFRYLCEVLKQMPNKG